MMPGVEPCAPLAAWPAMLRYGLAHFGKSLFWYGSELLFAFYLTEVAGLSAGVMGWVLAAGLLVSAAIDILVGARLGRWLRGVSGAGQVQLVGAVSSSGAAILLFGCALLPSYLRLAAVIVCSIGFRIGYSFYDIPQNALMSLGALNSGTRTRLASLRYIFSGFAALAVAAMLPWFLQPDDAGMRLARYLAGAVLVSCVAIASAVLLANSLRHAGDCTTVSIHPNAAKQPLSTTIRMLLVLMFVISLAGPTFSKLEPYFAAFTLRDPWLGSGIAIAVAIGMTVAQPLWNWAGRWLDRRDLLMATAGAVVVTAALFLATASARPGLTLATALAYGAASGGLGMALWAAFADVVAQGAQGQEGWAYGLFTASSKVALGLGGVMIGAVLTQIDYRGADSDALVQMMVVPSLFAGAACMLIVWWRKALSIKHAQRK